MPDIESPVRRPTRALRRAAAAVSAGLLLAAVVPGSTPVASATSRTWIVGPGQSIQAAVDQARSGDTIKIRAGRYAEAVCVVGKGLTIQGAGANQTVLVEPAEAVDTPCWVAGADPNGPVEGVSAIKFLDPDRRVKVSDLQTNGHPDSGIIAWGARGFTVTRTKGVGHGKYGILATAGSTDISITNNVERGVLDENGLTSTAGISVSDTSNARARVTGNLSEGHNLGMFLRESRNGLVKGNVVRDNCVGILVFDDSTTEKPDASRTVVGGDWTVASNVSSANNRFCRAGRDGMMLVSGVGMSVVNADKVRVRDNVIRNNVPSVPADTLNFPAAGLTILSIPSPTGGPDPGPARDIRVSGNVIRHNTPLDVLLATAPDDIVFSSNRCGVSSPASICD